jgi:hypothetical protein
MSGGNRSAYESRALTACGPNEHFLWNFNKQPAKKFRHLAGLCVTVFSKRRQESRKNTVEGTVKLVRFDWIDERPINGKSAA